MLKQLSNMVLLATLAATTVNPLAAVEALASDGPLVRVKDIADIEGVRSNMLIGYGLAVGLAGTGDSSNGVPFTRQTLVNILERLGLNTKDTAAQLKSKNIAAVMVTARLPSFARQGGYLDVNVSSLGDAKSLEGAQLLATPLVGADGNTYAVAQGAVVIGGFTAEGKGGTVTKNHPTSGRVANGAIVERETGFELADMKQLRLVLKNPDFTTAERLSNTVNKSFNAEVAHAIDNHTVDVKLPARYDAYKVPAIDKIENLTMRPDTKARVVIDEKTGAIVMGEDVRLSTVAISHANLTVRITELPQVSQPNALAKGETKTVERTSIDIKEGDGHFNMLRQQATLADLVNGLNSLGVKPRDIISILQTIKAAGAMQADIEML